MPASLLNEAQKHGCQKMHDTAPSRAIFCPPGRPERVSSVQAHMQRAPIRLPHFRAIALARSRKRGPHFLQNAYT